MKFYNNAIPPENQKKIDEESFYPIKEPNLILQFIIIVVSSFLLLLFSQFVARPIFGHYVRVAYSTAEYNWLQVVLALLLSLLIRPFLKLFLLPSPPFSNQKAVFYILPTPYFQVNYLGTLSKTRIIVYNCLQFLINLVLSLSLMHLKGQFYYTFELYMFFNAIISSYGIYNIILALKTPNSFNFLESGSVIYCKDPNASEINKNK